MLRAVHEDELIAGITVQPLMDCDFLSFQIEELHPHVEAEIVAQWELHHQRLRGEGKSIGGVREGPAEPSGKR